MLCEQSLYVLDTQGSYRLNGSVRNNRNPCNVLSISEENVQLELIMRTCMRLYLVASPHSGLAIVKRRCLVINLIRLDTMSPLVNEWRSRRPNLLVHTVGIVTNIHLFTGVSENTPASGNTGRGRGACCDSAHGNEFTERASLDTPLFGRKHRDSHALTRSLAYLCVFGYFLNFALLASRRLAVSRGSAEIPCARCLRGARVGLSGTSTLLYLSNCLQSCWMRSSRSSRSCSRRRIVSSRSRTSFCSSPALAIMSGGGATMCVMCVSNYADRYMAVK